MVMDVKNERNVTWAEARKFLEKKAKEKELGYEQKNALEHLRKFCKNSEKKTEELMEDLGKIEKLKEKHRIMVANMMPQDPEDMRVLFQHEIIDLSEEDKKKVLSIVKKYSE